MTNNVKKPVHGCTGLAYLMQVKTPGFEFLAYMIGPVLILSRFVFENAGRARVVRSGEFLRHLWGKAPAEAAVTLWFKPTKGSWHLPVSDVLSGWDEEDDDEIASCALDVYTSPGLRRLGLDPEHQGTRRDVVALAGFVVDLDLARGVHKANQRSSTKLPLPTDEDVAAILERAAGPDPSLVVDTGGGLHFWWLFESPWLLPDQSARALAGSAYESFHAGYVEAARDLGFFVDTGTRTIQHQFRLPGSRNQKFKEPKPITVEYVSDSRIAIPMSVPLRQKPVTATTASTAVPQGDVVRLDVSMGDKLKAVRAWMKRIRPDHKAHAAIQAVLRGESFAEPGERNNAMYQVVSTIAWLTPARELSADDLVEILRPSLAVWAGEPDAEKDLDDELDIARQMFESAIDNRTEKDAKERSSLDAVARGLSRVIRANEKPVAEDEDDPGVGDGSAAAPISTNEILECSIVQYRSAYFAWSFGQQKHPIPTAYHGPFTKEEVLTQLKSLWENAPTHFDLLYENDKSEEKPKPLARVMQEYATGAHKIVGHIDLQESYFDIVKREYHRATCPLRVLDGLYDPTIDEWLHLLGGDQADKLLDWLAAIPQVDRPLCALYLEGPPAIGKTNILAWGISRLWRTSGPAAFTAIMDQYNPDMFECPFILLDEGLPKRASQTSAFIRRLISSTEHSFNEKYVPMHKVLGCVRLMVAANNDKVLAALANEDLGESDVEAMVGRFLHIKADDKAARWINLHNSKSRSVIDSWRSGDLLAKHIIWLAENRTVSEGSRFLVDGEATEMHRSLVTRGEKQGLVLEWLARFMIDPDRVESRYKSKKQYPLALCGNDQILVNTMALVDCHDIYRKSELEKIPPVSIGKILSQLSHKKRQLGARGERIKYHLINFDNILRAADELQLNTSKMEENYRREADFEIEAVPLKLV